MLQGMEIIIGVTGGIAAYKTCYIVSQLKGEGANITVIMTPMAQEFIAPLTFQTLSDNRVITDFTTPPDRWEIEHIALSQKADLVLICPATANVINKLAGGIADDVLTTLVLACQSPIVICPAMNKNMYESKVVQQNIKKLQVRGFHFVGPERGRLACGEEGIGRLADEQIIINKVKDILIPEPDFVGKTVLVTAGPTREAIDPVRFITNASSGKMGYALASQARRRGAKVILISGPANLNAPKGVELVKVTTAQEMYEKVLKYYPQTDIVIGTAAVGDWRVKQIAPQKIKKSKSLTLNFIPNVDILAALGKNNSPAGERKILVGFAAETENLIKNAKLKLYAKNLDLIIANDARQTFAQDVVQAVIIDKKGKIKKLPKITKDKLAKEILDKIKTLC